MTIQYTGDTTTLVETGAPGEFWVVGEKDEVFVNGSDAIRINHTDVTLVIEGHVASNTVNGVRVSSDGAFVYITSSGLVEGNSGTNWTGIYSPSANNTIINDGKVVNEFGIYASGNGNTIINNGKATGRDNSGIFVSGEDNAIVNYGRAKGDEYGLYSSGSDNNMQNHGEVIGGDIGVLMNGSGDDLINTGTITVKNGATAVEGNSVIQDVYNSGLIEGDVVLLGGNDSYDGRGGGEVKGKVFGGDGNDYLKGSMKKDKLYGEDDNDSLLGKSGKDKLNGGDGLDDINGGKGNDQLRGGADADNFVFAGRTDDDVIKDWENGSDMIDLTAFAISNTTKFINKAISNSGGDAYIDLKYAGGKGVIKVDDAGGDIDFFDFHFV